MRSLLRRRRHMTAHAKGLLLCSTLAILLLPAGCTGAAQKNIRTASMERYLPLEQINAQGPSVQAEMTFAQLKLYSALRAGDRAAILDSTERMLSHLEKNGENSKNEASLSAAAFVDAAIWLISNDSGDEAAALAERASRLLPEELPLTALQADLLGQQDRAEEAIALLNDFIKRHPENEKAQAELALVLLRSGQADEAMKAFRRIPEKKLTPQIRFAYAQALNAVREFTESEKQLRAAVKAEPEYAEAWQLLALTLEEMDRRQEAMSIYSHLLSTDPTNRSARLFLLRGHLQAGDLNAAVNAVAESQDPLRFAVAATAILMEEKRFDEAENLMAQLEKLPDMPRTIYFYHAGMLYENGGDLVRALQLLALVPGDTEEYNKAMRVKVRILCDMDRLSDALETLEVVRELNPNDVEPLLLKAELLTRQKKWDEAEATLRSAIEAHPDNESALFQFAYLHEFMGKRSEAMRLMEEVIQRFPDNAMALNYVGYNLADSGTDLERALELTSRAVSLEPEADYIVDSLAWACFKLGRIDEAWMHIQRAVELNSAAKNPDPAMLEHFGDIAMARRDTEGARMSYEASYDIFLKHNLKNDAERVHNKLKKL